MSETPAERQARYKREEDALKAEKRKETNQRSRDTRQWKKLTKKIRNGEI